MASAAVAGTGSVVSGGLKYAAQKNIDLRLESMLLALAKWEYFLSKSRPNCDITAKHRDCPTDFVCWRYGLFFDANNGAGRRPEQGWCLPALQPLREDGAPCMLQKECASGYCHYGDATESFQPSFWQRTLQTFGLSVKEKDFNVALTTTGTCMRACKQGSPYCEKLAGNPHFGIIPSGKRERSARTIAPGTIEMTELSSSQGVKE